jgi:triosephosphate isomerase
MSTPRRPLVVGNWKMNGTLAEAVVLTRDLQARLVSMSAIASYPSIDVVITPPFTAIALVAEQLNLIRISDVHLPPRSMAEKQSPNTRGGLRVELGAQNMSEFEYGAFTGEISPLMLRELGARWVLLGHSERRTMFGETDEHIALKVRAALNHGFTPIIAVGETLEQHTSGQAIETVTSQTQAAFGDLAPELVAKCIVAYEPIWAIGTGKHDDPANANCTMAAIRACVPGLENVRILYGGSVKPDNAAAFFAQPDIDGALVGGASLDPDAFITIIQAADEAGKVFQRS